MSLARKILGNTFAQVAGRFATALLAVIVVKILTGYLGQAGYGKYATIYEFLAFFGAFADFGIFTIAVREMSKDKNKEAEIFGNALTLRTIFTCTALFVAAVAVFFVPQYRGTVIPFGVAAAALSTFFVIMAGTYSAALQMRLRMEIAAIALVLGKVVTVLAIVGITQFWFPQASEKSFFLVVWAGTLGGAVTFLITAFATTRVFPVTIKWNAHLMKQLLYEAAPFAIALALNTLYIRMGILLLSLLLPQSVDGACAGQFCGDTEVGSYAVATRILEIVFMIPIYFMNSVLPTLSESLAKKSARAAAVIRHAFLFLVVIGIPCGMLMMLLSREAAGVISAAEFLSTPGHPGSDTAMRILGMMTPLAFCSVFFGFLLIAIGKQVTLIRINLVTVIFHLTINLISIPRFGFVGAAYSSLTSETVMLAQMIYFAHKAYPLSLDTTKALKVVLSGIMAGLAAYLVHEKIVGYGILIGLFGTSAIYFIVFSIALWKAKVISPEILRLLKKGEGVNEIVE